MIPVFPINVKLPKNAVLIFEINTGSVVVDEVTGNPVNQISEIRLDASLTEIGDRVKEVEQPGLNSDRRFVRGYILDDVPSSVLLEGRIKCEISGKSGIFHFTQRISPLEAEIKKLLGTPVQGYFQTEGGSDG